MENKNIIKCYRCLSPGNLLIEEKMDCHTGKIAEKNFICFNCSNLTKEAMEILCGQKY